MFPLIVPTRSIDPSELTSPVITMPAVIIAFSSDAVFTSILFSAPLFSSLCSCSRTLPTVISFWSTWSRSSAASSADCSGVSSASSTGFSSAFACGISIESRFFSISSNAALSFVASVGCSVCTFSVVSGIFLTGCSLVSATSPWFRSSSGISSFTACDRSSFKSEKNPMIMYLRLSLVLL